MGLVEGQNNYGYTFGNPISLRDPSGRCPWCVAGALIGAAVNIGIVEWESGGHATGQQVLAAGISGGITGFFAGLAGPVGGTLAGDLLDASASGLTARLFGAGISAAGSAIGQADANAIDPCHKGNIGVAAAFGGLGQFGASFVPVRGMYTELQASYFGPSTLGGLLGSSNSALLLSSYGASSLVGAGPLIYSGGP